MLLVFSRLSTPSCNASHGLFVDCSRASGYVRDRAGRGTLALASMPMVEAEHEEDGEIILKVSNGDRPALGRLYDRYASLLLAVGRRIVGDAREAEDLVHDVFLEVWRSAGDYDAARGSVRAWILMRLRSRALDRKKSPRVTRQIALTEEAAASLVAVSDDPQLAPDRARVRRALAELPPEQRAVLELGYYEGLSSSEIATRVEAPIGTVKSRVAAGLAKLRAGLDIGYREVE